MLPHQAPCIPALCLLETDLEPEGPSSSLTSQGVTLGQVPGLAGDPLYTVYLMGLRGLLTQVSTALRRLKSA